MAQVLPGSWVVRAAADPRALPAAVREQVRAIDPTAALSEVRAMTEVVDRSIAQQRFNMSMLLAFAALALAVAMIGIHGVISYAVTQRTRETGSASRSAPPAARPWRCCSPRR